MSVDGTDCHIPEHDRDWYSQKHKKLAIYYKVAVSILGGDICCISGPYQPRVYNDLDIFQGSLATFLDSFEWVEAVDGYLGEVPMRVSAWPSSQFLRRGKRL